MRIPSTGPWGLKSTRIRLFCLYALFLFGEEKKDQKEKLKKTMWDVLLSFLVFLKFFWASFLSRKDASFQYFLYFPTQNREKMRSMTVASTSRPVMAPR